MSMRKVIKLGGSVWDTLHPDYFAEWKGWVEAGHELILLHGGGPRLSAYCETQQIKPVFQNGRRVTTEDVLTGATRVLAGEMQTEIVTTLGRYGVNAVGLSGVDGRMITGREMTELGAVGEVEAVDVSLIELLTGRQYVPVVTSILSGENGALNCNGDDCAVAVACALQADYFEMITDVPGIRINGTFREMLTVDEMQRAIESGDIYGGMIPKTEALRSALKGGVALAVIRDGNDPTAAGTQMKEGHHERITSHIWATSH
ncbi:acetylglutamate kinase [Exiguobacterium sp.]|uniref:acetylglutamate kinase n=1 Tax=Exiguobacterium sp. TaxID=44751 RepID=UPI00263AEEC4|nr:acetylglutamate kinase [Exiguobacterium sp.]MCC5892894.1 acetylglutamate kinase [Exiguobacterium sp.]